MSGTTQNKFDLGTVTATPAAITAIRLAGQTVHQFIARHAAGDWGDLDAADKRLNDAALTDGSRIFSVYVLRTKVKVWTITEAAGDDGNRASTCVLLPDEY